MISGHIRTRGTVNGKNTYQVIIELGTDSGGNRKRQSKSGFTTKKAAEKYLAEVIAGVRDIDEVHEKKKAAKVKDWMNDWLDTYLPNIAETTRRGYKEKIKEYIIPEFGDLMLTQIDKKRVQTWVNKLSEKGLSPKTIKEAYGCLNRSFEKAVDLDYIKSNPADKTVLPKPRQHTLNCLDTANGKDLLEKVKDTPLFLPVLLALTLGLRRGEMLALKWDDFDFTKGVVHIHNNRVCGTSSVITKAPKSTAGLRDIPISGTVRDLFLTEKEKYDTEKHRIGFKDNGNIIHNPRRHPITSRYTISPLGELCRRKRL